MKRDHAVTLVFLSVFCFMSELLGAQTSATDTTDVWVTAYYAGWSQGWYNNGVLPAEEIDYSAVTHIIHFALWPNEDGSLDTNANSIREMNSQALISGAHANGVKVLISVGGWGSNLDFRGGTSPLNLLTFVNNLVGFMTRHSYDGIDIDWEPIDATDAPQYILFIRTLRQQLDSLSAGGKSPRPLLTAAVAWQAPIFAQLANEFDQINIMTYDMSGAWPGWVTWHNAPLYDGGFVFPSTGRPVPSADRIVGEFIEAGVPPAKLGIGIDFYGYIWSGGNGTPTGGASAPRQAWTAAPQVRANVPYYTLIENTYRPEYFRWDSSARAAYLGINHPGQFADKFVTYDNEIACEEKIRYARERKLGGVFIWELGGGYLPAEYPYRDRLLQSVKIFVRNLTEIPSAPVNVIPPNNIEGLSPRTLFRWDHAANASWYQMQISLSPDFSSLVVDQAWIIENQHDAYLSPDTKYYWRVRAKNVTGEGSWSTSRTFSTIPDTLMPDSWTYISSTGASALVSIPQSASVRNGRRILQTGDIIGVFYHAGTDLRCAGYAVWTDGTDMNLVAWGDNSSTTDKDGFASGDTMYLRLWDAQRKEENNPTAFWRHGDNIFRDGEQSFVDSLAPDEKPVIPLRFNLAQNYPNPFNPSTVILYELSVTASIRLEVFNLLGERVKVLVDGIRPAQSHKVFFDAGALPSGVYFYRLTVQKQREHTSAFIQTRKMLLLR